MEFCRRTWRAEPLSRANGTTSRGNGKANAIRVSGAKLFFLPKYSPDLNPIEMFFSELKHGLRKAARRTHDAIYGALADLPHNVQPASVPTSSPKLDTIELKVIPL